MVGDVVLTQSRHGVVLCLQDVEQRLLLDCGCCPYQRALVLASVALVQPAADRQTALLEVWFQAEVSISLNVMPAAAWHSFYGS